MFKIVTLKNGLRLALEEMDNTRAISFGIWTRNGSRDESLETSGISHFIEHMLFKGTIRRSSKQIADDIDAVSGHLNAYTTKDYTCYHVRTLDIHFDQALDVLSDMFLNSKFDDEELSKERGVILEEIDMYEDSPDELSHDLLQRGMFGDHSLGLPILGTKQSISKFGHETLKNYFVNNYAPSRIVLSMTGRFKTDEAVAKLEKIFGGLKDPENPAKLAPPPAIHPCVITRSKDIEQAHLCLGFPGISMGDDRNYVLSILNSLFGGSMSSLLFQIIREQHGLAYSVYSYPAMYMDTGIYTIYVGFNSSQAREILNLIFQITRNFFSSKISQEQFNKAREQIKSNIILNMEGSASRMTYLGRSQLLLNRTLVEDQVIERLDKTTLDDMYALAEYTFNPARVGLCVVGKLGDWDYEELIRNAKY